MWRKVWGVALVLTAVLMLAIPAKAAGEFISKTKTIYEVDKSGNTHVKTEISLTNKLSTIYASSYEFSFEGTAPVNLAGRDSLGEMKTEVKKEGEITKAVLQFNEKVVGKDKNLKFWLDYDLPGATTHNGQVWEVSLPKLGENQKEEEQKIYLVVPVSFGKPAAIFPEPVSQEEKGGARWFSFNPKTLSETGVVASFGNFQLFDFDLTYRLANGQKKEAVMKIALPPDTARQRVAYKSITPEPVDVEVDEDGNWLAKFKVPAGQTVVIRALGTVQIFALAQERWFWPEPADWGTYLSAKTYWPSDDEEIQKLALKLVTPEKIYNFVVTNLSYDYKRIQQGVERLGGKKALLTPQSAICTEFTDLFISLARAAGTASREVEGFAYTTNPEIQPLSLVADVLHAWPEYWDSKKREWIPVDPTWGKTTGGVDYFNSFDLNHVVFAIHGQDPVSPPPAGSYKLANQPQKDVVVSFGSQPPTIPGPPEAQIEIKPAGWNGRNFQIKARVVNKSGSAWYKLPVQMAVAGAKTETPLSWEVAQLPPFGTFEKEVTAKEPWWTILPPGDIRAEVSLGGRVESASLAREKFWARWILPDLVLVTMVGLGGIWGWKWTKRRINLFFDRQEK